MPRIEPPVGIRGRPTIDLLFSIFFGTSQLRRVVVVVNDLFHLGAACRPRHGFEGASVVDWMLKMLLGLAIEMKERAYDMFRRWLIHFAC